MVGEGKEGKKLTVLDLRISGLVERLHYLKSQGLPFHTFAPSFKKAAEELKIEPPTLLEMTLPVADAKFRSSKGESVFDCPDVLAVLREAAGIEPNKFAKLLRKIQSPQT